MKVGEFFLIADERHTHDGIGSAPGYLRLAGRGTDGKQSRSANLMTWVPEPILFNFLVAPLCNPCPGSAQAIRQPGGGGASQGSGFVLVHTPSINHSPT